MASQMFENLLGNSVADECNKRWYEWCSRFKNGVGIRIKTDEGKIPCKLSSADWLPLLIAEIAIEIAAATLIIKKEEKGQSWFDLYASTLIWRDLLLSKMKSAIDGLVLVTDEKISE